MREIKFRFWQKEDEEMSEPMTLEDGFTGGMPSSYCFLENDCVAMQYTGLKDKNGKEIYEGDIIDTKYDGKITVEWLDKGSYDFENGDGCVGYYFPNSMTEDFEVLGNIYENPELLK